MGASNSRLSPRQKMINLMYIVLMAMLALNVSSDVLDGFTQVKDGLVRTNDNIEQRNASIIGALEEFSLQNPEKGLSWFQKGLEVRQKTTEIYNLVDSLKVQIVKKVDGSVTINKPDKALTDIPPVFLVSVVERCFCKLARCERRDRAVDVPASFMYKELFVRRIDREPFRKAIGSFSSCHIFLDDKARLYGISEPSVDVVGIGKRETLIFELVKTAVI